MINVTSPETVGMSSERLARLDTYIRDSIGDNKLPGVLTLVQRCGEIVHFGCQGLMDIEANKPMREDAIFRLYSMTKPITSIALMMLFEEGKFSLYDPVAMYIPAFAKTQVYEKSKPLGMRLVPQDTPMNIRHLLTHTSGLSYGFNFDNPVEELYRAFLPKNFRRDQTLKESIEALAELPLLFQPGTKWNYSISTDVCGYLVEVLSGMPFADFLQERVLKPLGMDDTAFQVAADKVERLMQIYTTRDMQHSTPMAPEDVAAVRDVTTPTLSPMGGAGLTSTIGDYLKFANCLLNQGVYDGGRLISRKTLDLMTANHIPAALFPLQISGAPIGAGFGLGFRIVQDLGIAKTLTSNGEFGWAGAAKTHFLVDPQEELITLFMTQMLPVGVDYPMRERYQTLVYQAIVD